ncbi:hypothetical protein [Bradyrhizobium pachyrhizi]|uniref:hypothetical protein n=1 Tax=Bradyrhizobium pachyrhizi TaxID=280333 RepID=UPI003D36BDEB
MSQIDGSFDGQNTVLIRISGEARITQRGDTLSRQWLKGAQPTSHSTTTPESLMLE